MTYPINHSHNPFLDQYAEGVLTADDVDEIELMDDAEGPTLESILQELDGPTCITIERLRRGG